MAFSLADYRIGWICALPIERTLATAMLDRKHPKLPTPGDENAYTFGEVRFDHQAGVTTHNVVIACLPSGLTGKASAATVAKDMERTFDSLKFGLMIGIAGGVWSDAEDVRLGDVVVGMSEDGRPGILQYDHGKTIQDKDLEIKGTMNKAPRLLLSAISEVQSNHLGSDILYLSYLNTPAVRKLAPRPAIDELYNATYKHQNGKTCHDCDKAQVRLRNGRFDEEKNNPVVHYGIIASGDQVMRDAITAEKIRKKHNVLCFEMEAAGLDAFKCLVIRGISDYADTHKNDDWHRYAAAVAAAYAKELLSVIAPHSVSASPTVDHRNDLTAQLLPKLYVTDPRHDKTRLLDIKGVLSKQSFAWVLNSSTFLDWRDNDSARLLWIAGDPGRGKTMMCIGLIDEISAHLQHALGSGTLSYFFCQSQYSNLNNPVSVLKGIIWLLIEQNRTLGRYLHERFATVGQSMFQGPNALYELWEVFENIMNDSACGTLFIIIDALDECDQDSLDILLKCITNTKTGSPQRVKWLLTSRNSPDIKNWLDWKIDEDGTKSLISLEVNAVKVSDAVDDFIESKTKELAKLKKYDKQLREEVKLELQQKAEGTFLWVSLVCRRLERVSRLDTKSAIAQFPKGLEPLYERMLRMMLQSEHEEQARLCLAIIRSAILTYNPLHIKEVGRLAGLSKGLYRDYEYLHELVEQCGSFLTMRGDIVSFVHQSAKQYLDNNRQRIFMSQPHEEHLEVTFRCMGIMSETLTRNMGALDSPGSVVSDAKADAVQDFVAQCGYSVCFWVDHLKQASLNNPGWFVTSRSQIEGFIRTRLLQWLEILSLMDKMSTGRKALKDLGDIIHASARSEMNDFVAEADRFFVTYAPVISQWPLQTYISAIIFSPWQSPLKQQFQDEYLDWISVAPLIEENRNSALQVLEGHKQAVTAVSFSPNGKLIASGSLDTSVMIWNVETGTLSKTITGHSLGVTAVAFSPDSELVASASEDMTVKLWPVAAGKAPTTLDGHTWKVSAVCFSPVDNLLASASHDYTIKLWDIATGTHCGILKDHTDNVNSVDFSPDGKLIASASRDKSVRLWETRTLLPTGLLEGHTMEVTTVSFSPDGKLLASASRDRTIRVWDVTTRKLRDTIHDDHAGPINAVIFSADSTLILSASNDRTIRLKNITKEAPPTVLKGHLDRVSSVDVSPDSRLIASASWDKTVRLWDTTGDVTNSSFKGRSWDVAAIALSPDCGFVASACGDPEVKLWATATGAELHRFKMKRPVWDVSFSDDQRQIQTNQEPLSLGHIIGHCSSTQSKVAAHIDIQDQWVIWRSKRVIWLPSEYRTTVFAVRGDTVALSCHSGYVLTMVFDADRAKVILQDVE